MKFMLIVVEEIIKKLLKITGKILEVRNMVYLMKKIASSASDDEGIQLNDSIETCIWNGQRCSM